MAYSRLRRSSDQRKALLRDLVTDLILNGKIETTVAKAKELLDKDTVKITAIPDGIAVMVRGLPG